MNQRDRMTVETYVGTGMDLDTLYTCFPDFDRAEIAEIYNSYKSGKNDSDEEINISCNCS